MNQNALAKILKLRFPKAIIKKYKDRSGNASKNSLRIHIQFPYYGLIIIRGASTTTIPSPDKDVQLWVVDEYGDPIGKDLPHPLEKRHQYIREDQILKYVIELERIDRGE